MSHFLKYKFPAIAWAMLIFVASSIPSASLPTFVILSYDKLIHISIFFVFGLLSYRALEPRQPLYPSFTWKRVGIAIGLVILYGAVDEIHQGFVPGRTLDHWDLLADTVGGLLAGLVLYVAQRRSNPVA